MQLICYIVELIKGFNVHIKAGNSLLLWTILEPYKNIIYNILEPYKKTQYNFHIIVNYLLFYPY